MKTDNLRKSQQVEDRRGQSSASFGGCGNGGSHLLQLFFQEKAGKPS
ncbi:UNVERIFIED_CONTAM: hypothetical protein KB579_02100 [Streptococcus canis]|uniref:Uncharacterized protein n=1 Tax=Streptococcus canis TaxID=1329 RepID=A0A3P5Y1W7_STRCB|nr:hypothetical protein [Streptococcus canis]QKG77304.1 hypothetical protein GE021_003820 [Streptococcus canis]VDC41925.1 hypothetical protein FMV2238Y02_03420 [Streptococcus canis]